MSTIIIICRNTDGCFPTNSQAWLHNKCGNVSIPYPFGIGEGCFLEESFELRCHNSIPVDRQKPMHGGFYVSEISIAGGYMITDFSISTHCPNNQIQNFGYSIADSFSKKFTFSATRNKLTAIGCNTYAYLGLNSSTYTAVGCMPLCNRGVVSTNGSCTGSGCCQASVPAGLRKFTLTTGSLNEIQALPSSNPCSYAFLVESNSFEFFSSYLQNFKDNGTESVPVAIDWKVGTETCWKAQRNSKSYACGPNTECVEGDAPGYRCECKRGHEGHPYSNRTTDGRCQGNNYCILLEIR
ncbi:hypothetical protein MKW98_015002 [Papaver atlanticum]|uniref:Wall-associated receptor kinase galacturonan-binding domain-containing protein n=1 Tax=Papaver atlanticum TaxID=357466 RepID=A0AAD4XAH0_9MAGN|nr:hypothetical protein MKW98_015002 [Papaver atlanticum]